MGNESNRRTKAKPKTFMQQLSAMTDLSASRADNPNVNGKPSLADKINFGGKAKDPKKKNRK